MWPLRPARPAPGFARLPEGVEIPDLTWPVVLRCGPVVLRPLRRADVGQWAEVRERNREWTGPWDATPPPTRQNPNPQRRTDLAATIRTMDRKAMAGEMLPWAICWDDGWQARPSKPYRLPMAGQVNVNNIVRGSARFASIGYWIDESLAGRGVMPVAVALAVDYCFGVLDLHRIEVCIRPENAKSLRVVEKLGLREEGLRPRFLHIDGDWRDHRSFSVLAEDVPDGLLARYLATHPMPSRRA